MNRRSLLASVALAPLALVPSLKPREPSALTERERALLDALADVARASLPARTGFMYRADSGGLLNKVHDALDAYGTPPSGAWEEPA